MAGQEPLFVLYLVASQPAAERESCDWFEFERDGDLGPCIMCHRPTRGRYCLQDVDEFDRSPMCGACWIAGTHRDVAVVDEVSA